MRAGERIGPYLIEARLGEGGMGEVYRARDTRLDRTVAIKVAKAEFSERFAREAKAVAALNHPNICTLHDVGPNYLVMEHIEGAPLKGPLPLEKAVEYASQILDALQAAHGKGFAHHDLKPANVMVSRQGIKLLDFGLAQRSARAGVDDATRTSVNGGGEIAGTLQYMAPEQLQGKTGDARSDLFAFGCVLYELISGKKAFDGDTSANVITAIMSSEPAPLDVPPALWRVVRTCLEKDPEQRFQTARDVKRTVAWAMEQPSSSAAGKGIRWPWIAAAALVIGALAGGFAFRSRQAPADEQAVRFQITPPEGGRFDPSMLAVSPDGRMLAYVAMKQGKSGLWVRPLDSGAARALPGTEGAFYPFWSPDSRSVGYYANDKLWRFDLAGGAPLALCEASHAPRGGTWGADGVIVFGAVSRPLTRVSAGSGSPVPLTALDVTRGERYHGWPQLLPGSRSVLFYIAAAKAEDTGIYAVQLDNPSKPIRIVSTTGGAVFAAGHLLWRRGTTLLAQRFDPDRLQLFGEPRAVTDPVGTDARGGMAVAASSGGLLLYGTSTTADTQLAWLDRTGKPAGSALPAGDYGSPALSPDGRQVAVNKLQDSGSDVWTVERERNVARRLTFSGGFFPVWSPDGRTIVFRSASSGSLFRKDGSGAEERISTLGNIQTATDWSRDGRSLLYYEIAPETNRDLWVLPVTPDGKPEPGAKPRPYLRTSFNERFGRFSPEPHPRWVAYESDESGRYEVYVQGYLDPKTKWLVSSGGGQYPAWNPDGREIFYVSAESKLMAVKLRVTADSIEPLTPTALFEVAGNFAVGSPYAVSPDGRSFLARVPVDKGAQPLEVIVNWPALLKKGSSAE